MTQYSKGLLLTAATFHVATRTSCETQPAVKSRGLKDDDVVRINASFEAVRIIASLERALERALIESVERERSRVSIRMYVSADGVRAGSWHTTSGG